MFGFKDWGCFRMNRNLARLKRKFETYSELSGQGRLQKLGWIQMEISCNPTIVLNRKGKAFFVII